MGVKIGTLGAHSRAQSARPTSSLARVSVPALVFLLAAAPAHAACGDPPKAGVDWSGCQKVRLVMRDVDLSGGGFNETFFTSSDLRGANLAGADLTRAELSNASLAGADLSGAVLQKTVGTRTDLSGADLSGADLTAAEFSRTNFQRANLSDATFTDSEMNRSDFSEADLTGANMAKAELARVILTAAVISGVTFSYSNLSRADLRDTDLEDADLTGTYMFLTQLGGADLSRTKGLTGDQLAIACGSSATLLPQGLRAPEHWPCPDYDDDQ